MIATGEESRERSGRMAPRYDIVTPVQYRPAGGQWRDGTTVNMGRLGLLMRASSALPPSTVLELRVVLTTDHARPGAIVAGCGHVVRVDPSSITGEMLVAVALDDFRLEPAAHAGPVPRAAAG